MESELMQQLEEVESSDGEENLVIDEALYWTERIDEDTGRPLYYNRKTHETISIKPQCLEDLERESMPDPDDPSRKKENWMEGVDKASGRTYYYNQVTRETTWARPDIFGFAETITPIPVKDVRSGEENLGDPKLWRQAVDRRTGRTCYVHKKTGQTSWNKPVGYDDLHNLNQKQATRHEEDNKEEALIEISDAPENPNERLLIVLRAKSEKAEAKKVLTLSDDEEDVLNASDDDEEEEEDTEMTMQQLNAMTLIHDRRNSHRITVSGKPGFEFEKNKRKWLGVKGKRVDFDTLLAFQSNMISVPLLKRNRGFKLQVVQSFKNIMSYMGDRKSGKNDILHAQKLIRNALAATDSVRDEIYLQICKQVTDHPILEHCIKGWELLMIVLASFPPSKRMYPFLKEYIEVYNTDEHSDSEIRRISNICLNRLEISSRKGNRRFAPGQDEIIKDQASSRILLKISTMGDMVKTVEATPFSTVSEIRARMDEKLGIVYTTPFGIYQIDHKGNEFYLKDEERILDTYARWEMEKHTEDAGPEPFRFVFKAKLVLKTSNQELISDSEALHLMYVQAFHDVVSGSYPAEARDCPSLAALYLQATFGDFRSEKHSIDWIAEKLPELIPRNLILDRNGNYHQKTIDGISQKVLTKYTKLNFVSTQEAELSYLDYVQNWPLYGAAFFPIEQFFRDDEPTQLRLGVTCDAIILAHRTSNYIVDTYGYHEIVVWEFSETEFVLVVGDRIQQRKFHFDTKFGDMINHLATEYVGIIVKQQQKVSDTPRRKTLAGRKSSAVPGKKSKKKQPVQNELKPKQAGDTGKRLAQRNSIRLDS